MGTRKVVVKEGRKEAPGNEEMQKEGGNQVQRKFEHIKKYVKGGGTVSVGKCMRWNRWIWNDSNDWGMKLTSVRTSA